MKGKLLKGGIALAILSSLVYGVRYQSREAGVPRTYEVSASQDIKYSVGDRPPHELSVVMDYIRTNMERPTHRGEGYVIREIPGMEWSRVRPLNDTLKALEVRLTNDEVGAYWSIMAVKDRFRMWVLKEDLNPAVAMDTEGGPSIDIIWGTIYSRFPEVQNWGICACRRISGTWTWSQHAWCNGLDVGGGQALLDRVVSYTRDLVAKGYLPVSQTLWRVPGHYGHIHYSGVPLRAGTPPCV